MHQYAHVPQNGKTIHSAIQLESFGTNVDDQSLKLKQGTQMITMPDSYKIPLNFVNGLAYMPIRPFTDTEWEKLPHIVLTTDNDWDPSMADCDFSDSEHWYDALETHEGLTYNEPFDSNGRHAVEVNWHDTLLEQHTCEDRQMYERTAEGQTFRYEQRNSRQDNSATTRANELILENLPI